MILESDTLYVTQGRSTPYITATWAVGYMVFAQKAVLDTGLLK